MNYSQWKQFLPNDVIVQLQSMVCYIFYIKICNIIGSNCIINTSSLIEHNSVICSHCHISTKAIINGSVTIGDKTFIGSGAIICQGIKIGNNCVVSAGSIVKKNLSDNIIFNSES